MIEKVLKSNWHSLYYLQKGDKTMNLDLCLKMLINTTLAFLM